MIFLSEDFAWWKKETEEERLMRLLIKKAETLGRLPTPEDISNDSTLPGIYAFARVYGNIQVFLERLAGILYGNRRRTYPTELMGEQLNLPKSEQQKIRAELQMEYSQRLADVQDLQGLRAKLKVYQKKPELAEVTEKVTVIPATRRVRLGDYARRQPVKKADKSEAKKTGWQRECSGTWRNRKRNEQMVAPTLVKPAVQEIARQTATAIATQAIQATIGAIKEETTMSRLPKYSYDDAMKGLKLAYEHYGKVPTVRQMSDFAREHANCPGATVVVKMLGSSTGWAKILGVQSAADGALAGTTETSEGTEVTAVPEILPEAAATGAATAQSVTVSLTGTVNAEVCVQGRVYKVQIQLGKPTEVVAEVACTAVEKGSIIENA